MATELVPHYIQANGDIVISAPELKRYIEERIDRYANNKNYSFDEAYERVAELKLLLNDINVITRK